MIPLRWRIVEAALVAFTVAGGVAIRTRQLDASPLWVDEAESSINALTILEHGYPADHYLGIPIFENTLIKPWLGNPEYEFKDLSYSDRGMAVYHGWLPLYSIAASFALNGVQPDKVNNRPTPERDLIEMKRRTRVARVPSVIFGALFLIFSYIAGTIMYGRDAGATALLMGSIMTFSIDASTQARYYSAVIALSTCAVLVLWLIWKNGKFKHYVAGAIVLLLLFFTHLVTFAAAGLVFAVLLTREVFLRPQGSLKKLAVLAAILLAGVGSWVAVTGFLSGLGAIPAARYYLSFPSDLISYPVAQGAHIVLIACFLLLIWAAFNSRFYIPPRLGKPIQESARAVILLSLWILAAYGAFFLLIPAVSFDVSKLKFPYRGPALLLGSIICAAIARMIAPRLSICIAPVVACLLVATTGVQLLNRPKSSTAWDRVTDIQAYIQNGNLSPNTRLYALQNSHLILSFYTGLPFQSIYPVRKTFLDTYPGEIALIDLDEFGLENRNTFAPAQLRQIATRAGEVLDDRSAQLLSMDVRTFPYRQSMTRRIGGVQTDTVAQMQVYANQLLNAQLAKDADAFLEMCTGTPILRGYHITNWREWVDVFVYRFVDPDSRMGPALNYGARLRGSRADILTRTGWVVYHSRPGRDSNAAVTFRLLP